MIRANFSGFVVILIQSGLNLMKRIGSHTFGCSLRVLLLAFIAPISIQANEKNVDDDFCQVPDASYQQFDDSQTYPLLEDIHDLKAISERGMLRVLLEKKKNACTISQTEQQLIQEFANINDLDLYWIYVDNDWELLPQLF